MGKAFTVWRKENIEDIGKAAELNETPLIKLFKSLNIIYTSQGEKKANEALRDLLSASVRS